MTAKKEYNVSAKFSYLMSKVEHAARQSVPANFGYDEKKKELFDYVAQLEKLK